MKAQEVFAKAARRLDEWVPEWMLSGMDQCGKLEQAASGLLWDSSAYPWSGLESNYVRCSLATASRTRAMSFPNIQGSRETMDSSRPIFSRFLFLRYVCGSRSLP